MEIVKVYKESLPAVRLIGKRYTNQDRDESGTFARYWQAWFQDDCPAALTECDAIPGWSEDFVGAMRITGEDAFEYWIGGLFAPSATAPDGFAAADIPAGDIGVCWLYGNDQSGELYGTEASDLSMAAWTENGWKYAENGWFFERYNCPRFTAPDEKGNVILDVCAYLV